jgi:hypothetical protein
MATFSLGTSGITPGAPGVYINEQPGKLANAELASFSTTYMLVETDEDVPVSRFPFNTPIKVSSLNDYKERIRVGNSTVPEARIPLLSYNCVQEFFANAQVGDLRVVRVGTPNQIVELEFFPSGSKINSTSLPSALMAGNKVFVQMTINGIPLVAGDGSTGYTADGEYLGVPVVIPANYVAGDEVNNRKISAAIAAAVAGAIDTNPAIASSVYVRDFGLLNDLDPVKYADSQNSYVSIASATFDGNVSVVTEVFPVGSNFVFMQNTYDIENIVGKSTDLERVPQDYTQCIATAFDGVQDQGYLITPTAYAQFDAAGRALVGAAAAAHCESNNFKWMALADPGPFLVTDINKYENFVPHKAAADLVTGLRYLVDNAIYEWTGVDVSYPKASYQSIVYGQSAEIAINESANYVPATTQVGLLDAGEYTVSAGTGANEFLFALDTDQYWPVTLPIQKVVMSGIATGNNFASVNIQGGDTGINISGEVYVIAAPFDVEQFGDYSLNNVLLATSAADASNIYQAAVLAGGSSKLVFGPSLPNGTVVVPTATGSTALLTYADPYWDEEVEINGQTSDLIENITTKDAGVNTLHFPGTLQDPTETYRLFWASRTIFNAFNQVATYGGTVAAYSGAAVFAVTGHGLRSGQKIYFTQPVVESNGSNTQNLVKQTTKLVSNPYWVKVISENQFLLSTSLTNYTVGTYIGISSGYTVATYPTIFYSTVLGGGETSIDPIELTAVPFVRGRKYEFDSSSIFSQAANAGAAPAPSPNNPTTSVYINNSSLILGTEQINPYGENLADTTTLCSWLPELNLSAPTTSLTPATLNAYCVPTVDQFFQPEAYMVPAINPIDGGDFNPVSSSTRGPITGLNLPSLTGGTGGALGTYNNVTTTTAGLGTGALVNVTIGNTSTVGPIATLGGVSAGGTGTVINAGGAVYNTNYFGVTTTVGGGPAGGNGAVLDVTVTSTSTSGPVNSINVGSLGGGTGTAVSATGTYTNTFGPVNATVTTGSIGTGATLSGTIDQTSTVGPVAALGTFTENAPDTSGAGPTTYTGLVATGNTGAGTLLVDVSVDGSGNVTGVAIASGGNGTGYTPAGAGGTVVNATFGTGGDVDIVITSVTVPIAVSTVSLTNGGTSGYDSSSVLSAAPGDIDGITGFSVQVANVILPIEVTAAAVATGGAGSGYNNTSVLNLNPVQIGGITGAQVGVAGVTLPTGITNVAIASGGAGVNYNIGDVLNIPATGGSAPATIAVSSVVSSSGVFTNVTAYATAAGLLSGYASSSAEAIKSRLVGVYFDVLANGFAPDGTTAIQTGDRLALTYDGSAYEWVAVAPQTSGGDLTAVGQVCYGSQIEMVFTPEQTPPSSLWRFDAITSTEIIDNALRGVGFNGEPQAKFIEAGIDNVNRLYDDSQRYFNPFGFIAYYGPYIQNGAGQWIPPSPYVTGVAVRRYRAEGYQFPPAGVRYQLADAVAAQIPINSAQQNLLNPDGCNAVRTLPGYPQTAVFIWGGRSRVNTKDAQQKLYQFVNTRVILNVVYGSLRTAFDSQIFNVIDGFGVIFNQIISVGNSILNELYINGALFGARPSDAFQVICDGRINPPEDIENGIVNAKVFVTPVPTLERIQIDLIRVAIGKMQQELDIQGLGNNNAAGRNNPTSGLN